MKGRFRVTFWSPLMKSVSASGVVTRGGTPHDYESWTAALRAAKRWMERGAGWDVTIEPRGEASA